MQFEFDTTPTTITSVTFLEADTTCAPREPNIINQNSTYFKTVSDDGDVLVYTSISSNLDPAIPLVLVDQMDIVPSGVMLVLFGVNAEGNIIQNTIAWGYINDYCEGEILDQGNNIGWVVLVEYSCQGCILHGSYWHK